MPVCDVGTAAVPLALSITNLHKSFSKLEALKGVNLKAKQGDVTAIDGEELRLKCARPDLQPAEKSKYGDCAHALAWCSRTSTREST